MLVRLYVRPSTNSVIFGHFGPILAYFGCSEPDLGVLSPILAYFGPILEVLSLTWAFFGLI